MSKPRSRLADYLVYIVIRMFVCLVQAIPFCSLPMLANGLAWQQLRWQRCSGHRWERRLPSIAFRAGKSSS